MGDELDTVRRALVIILLLYYVLNVLAVDVFKVRASGPLPQWADIGLALIAMLFIGYISRLDKYGHE